MDISYLRSRVIHRVRRGLTAIAARKLKRYPELVAALDQAKGSESAGVNPSDSVVLFETVRALDPKCVLELGPGTSTAIIAAALSDDAQFLAVEESQEWADAHRKQFPGLFSRVEMIQSDIIVTHDHGKAATCFEDIPLRPYDFIHIDGPSHAAYHCDVTCDILKLLPSLAARCTIIFDSRQASARLARPHLEAVGFKMHWNPYTLNRHFVRV